MRRSLDGALARAGRSRNVLDDQALESDVTLVVTRITSVVQLNEMIRSYGDYSLDTSLIYASVTLSP